MKRTLIVTMFALVAVFFGGCRDLDLVSGRKDRDIRIDGRLSDWKGIRFTEKGALSLGIVNDDSCLYIAVVATDRMARQQLMVSGLYLWFDESGGENKNFGVCFPVGGMEGANVEMRPQGTAGGSGERSKPPGGGPDSLPAPLPGGMPDSVGSPPPGEAPGGTQGGPRPGPHGSPPPTVFHDMMVYSAKIDDWVRVEGGSLGGLQTAGDTGRTALVLEVKIALERDAATGYGIGVRPGGVVGVGVESPEIKGGDPGSPGGGGPGEPGDADWGRQGGSHGSGPSGSGGMGGPEDQGGGEPRRPEPIKIWGTLTLAGRAN